MVAAALILYRRAGKSMNVKQISILLEDKPGTLYSIISALSEHNIHIRAFTVTNVEGVTELRIIVDNVLWTASLLKNMGTEAVFNDVIIAEVANSENGLLRILELLKGADINIEHAYPIMSKNSKWIGKEIYMVFEADDISRASKLLRDEGITLLTQEVLAAL